MVESLGVGVSLDSSTARILAICIRGLHQDGWEENNLQPMWTKSVKQVDLERRIPFLDQENLGCTQRECKPNKKLVDECKKSVRISDLPRNY